MSRVTVQASEARSTALLSSPSGHCGNDVRLLPMLHVKTHRTHGAERRDVLLYVHLPEGLLQCGEVQRYFRYILDVATDLSNHPER